MSRQAKHSQEKLRQLVDSIKLWGSELGFQQIGISDIDLSLAEARLSAWLQQGFHGTMDYMQRHGLKRSRPDLLLPGTVSVITVRMDYLPEHSEQAIAQLQATDKAYVSRYALGRDYHKLLRKRLQQLAQRIEQQSGPLGYRVFVDSAPVLEKPLAEKAGLGWIGKHTNLLNKECGSWFFLGEIYIDLPLPVDSPTSNHCGTCNRCIEVCPTQAIIAPYQLDARRCISYLTIELDGPIPVEFRRALGNRIYGCDDCQLFCPWNRFAAITQEADFLPRHHLDQATLLTLFQWNETTFLTNTEGSAIRRIGYERWQRNLAVALGNSTANHAIQSALQQRLPTSSDLVQEHIAWAIAQLT